MKLLILLLSIMSMNTYADINIVIKIIKDGKELNFEERNIKFDKTKEIKVDDFLLKYDISKKITDGAYFDPNNQKTISINAQFLERNSFIASPKVITIYGSDATLEVSRSKGPVKVIFNVSETITEKNRRISNIKRFPVYTETVFPISYQPIENVKKELEKILSKKGSIRIDKETNSLIVKETLSKIIILNKKINSIDI